VTTIRWAPQAADDLEAIRDFIARDSPHYARLVCRRIVASIEQLALFPLMGRVVPEMAMSDIRELIVAPYRIVYRIRGDIIEIATIFHAARLLPLKV
jgi:addiction module RelE/StbE family toxin